jgi:hypothetical protein
LRFPPRPRHGRTRSRAGGKAEHATVRLYEIPDGARVTTAIAPGDREFVTSRTGGVIRVQASSAEDAGDGQVWHAGRIIPGEPGGVEFTV